MADKGFGIKKINLIGASGVPEITSPNNLNLNAETVAISTDVTVGGQVKSDLIISTGYSIGIGSTTPDWELDIVGSAYASGNIEASTLIGRDLLVYNIESTGISTFYDNLDINSNVDISGSINVAGVSTFTDSVVFDSTGSIQVPVGNTSERPGIAVTGQLRYNSELTSFEGYGPGGEWGSLGGVKDVDGDTYIIPESSPNADEDTLYFYNAGTNTASISSTTATINVNLDVDGRTELDITNISETLNVVGISTFESGLNVNTLNASGIVTASEFSTGAEGSSIRVTSNTISGPAEMVIDPAAVGDDTGLLRIKGDLYVDGTEFKVDSTTINFADFNVGIATTVGSNVLLDGAGIGIGSDNIRKTITFENASNSLTSSENFNILAGKTYNINGSEVLSDTLLTVPNIQSSGVGTIATLDTTTGAIDYLTGTNISYSGVGTIATLDTDIATIDVLNTTTFASEDATITNIQSSGVGTIATLDTDIATIDYLTGTNISYSGVGTIATLDTDIATIDYLTGTNISYSGIGTIETLDTTTGTIDYLTGTNISYSGIGTIETLDTTTGTIDYLTGTNLTIINDVSVNGVSTFVGLTTFISDVYIGGVLYTPTLSVQGGATVSGDATFTGNIDANGSIDVDGHTELDDVNVSGVTTFQSNVYLGDSDVLNFGDSNDLQIYHDGNNSYVSDQGIGNLIIDGSKIEVQHGSSTKLETVSTGVTVTGDLRVTGIVTVGSSSVTIDGDNNTITVGTGVTIDSTGISIAGVSSLTATTIYGDFDGNLNSLGHTYYVSTTGSNSNSGTDINQPYLTIAQALSVATDGDAINIAAGTYEETCPLTIPRGVTVKGAGLRATTIKPSAATKTNNVFLFNDVSTLEDLTIRDSYYDSTADTGYAFAYAPGIAITTRSPYAQRITVLNKGTTITADDPYGYDTADSPPTSYIAGRGALVDGSVVAGNSIEAGFLFNEVTFFTPNNKGTILTNGARAEYLNCFHYFSSQAIVGLAGTVGIAGTADARLKFNNPGVTPSINDVVKLYDGGSVVAVGTITSWDDPYAKISGVGFGTFTSVGTGTTQDVRFFQSDGVTQTGIASAINLADYTMFGAEMRSVGCAVEYGAQGVVADGAGVQLRLFATNFNHVGSGKDLSNDPTIVVQTNEVIKNNGGQVSYVSIDQNGDFRVGESLYINQETGNVSFAATSYSLEVTGELDVTDGSNTSTLTPTSLLVGNIEIANNTIYSTSGDINLDPAGANEVNVTGNLNVSGILTASVLQTPTLQKNDTSVALDDTGSNGTIRLNTDGVEGLRVTSDQKVGINSSSPAYRLDVQGDINTSTAVKVNGVSVLQSASDEAIALAIALG